ncbi:MAG: hypothetical protein OXL41_00215 [Nitrospinae bacterium]|nr:hypothetical protein [Nitrospinota bacterium]
MFTGIAYAEATGGTTSNSDAIMWLHEPLFWIELLLLLLVLIGAPFYANWARRSDESSNSLRGLNLPRGSVRAMLALLIVGSFVNILVFGAKVFSNHYTQIITAFGTLAGAVVGFYFGGRQASPPPGEEQERKNSTGESP